MDQGLAANFDRIKANIEVLKIEIGQRLAPLVIRATNFIINNFDTFKDVAEDVRQKVVEISQNAFEIFNKVVDKSVEIFNKHIIPAFHKFVGVSKQVLKFVVDNKKEFIFLGSVVGGAAVAFKTAKLAQAGIYKSNEDSDCCSEVLQRHNESEPSSYTQQQSELSLQP